MARIRRSQASPKHASLLKLEITNRQKALNIQPGKYRKAVAFLLDKLRVNTPAVAIHFVSQKKICQLHRRLFDDPTPTDCITCPYGEGFLGEVFVCPQAALDYVEVHGGNPQQETLLYVIHGILHLLGYDDTTPKARARMRRAEARCLRLVKQSRLMV